MNNEMAMLIDANELKSVITEDWFLDILLTQTGKSDMAKKLVDLIDSVPLAYNMEKVVEELEKLPNREADYYYANSNDVIDREDAIDIVKRGGVE